MNYLIWKNNILYTTPKGERIASIEDAHLEELKGLFQIAVVKTTPRVFESDSTDPEELERIALQSLPEDYRVCYEKIEKNLYQVFGIEEILLGRFREVVNPERIDSLIPYQAAIRDYLEKKNIPTEEYTIFLDNTKDAVLFSVFHLKRVSPVRSLSRETFAREFAAAQEDFISTEKLPSIKFKVITNSEELKDKLIKEGTAPEEAITSIKALYPAIEGLKIGKREIEFILPEQIIRKQKEVKRRQGLRFTAITGAVAIVSILFLSQGYYSYHKTKRAIARLEMEKITQENLLEKAFQGAYQEIVRQQQNRHSVPALEKFFKYVPIGFNIRKVNLIRDKGGTVIICAYVQTKKGLFFSTESLKEIFPTALIENSSIEGSPAIRIIYGIAKNGEEVSGSPFRDRWEAEAKK